MTLTLKFEVFGFRIWNLDLDIDKPAPIPAGATRLTSNEACTLLGLPNMQTTKKTSKFRQLVRRGVKKMSDAWVGEMIA